jgi:hypothetical protein
MKIEKSDAKEFFTTYLSFLILAFGAWMLLTATGCATKHVNFMYGLYDAEYFPGEKNVMGVQQSDSEGSDPRPTKTGRY